MKHFAPVVVLSLAACAGRTPHTSFALEPSSVFDAQRIPPTVIDAAAPLARTDAMALTVPPAERLCQIAAGPQAASLGREVIASNPEPQCAENEPFCDTVDRTPRGADRCFVSNEHIGATEQQIARESQRRQSSTPATTPTRTTQSRVESTQWYERVDSHLHFNDQERAQLNRTGFVALGRLAHDSYALAYHEIFRQQLPVFISVDSILHAIFQSHGTLLQSIETTSLRRKLTRIVSQMRATLRRTNYDWSTRTRNDLDVYLTVADSLASSENEAKRSAYGNDNQVTDLLQNVRNGELVSVDLFGRQRMVDFSQYTPRGHYAEHQFDSSGEENGLQNYFRAMMWLSRIEFNLVSRSCRSSEASGHPNPDETPREGADALALAELAERAGVLPEIAEFERVYQVFAGHREDVSMPQLLELSSNGHFQARDATAPAQLIRAIGNNFQRTARTHFMPDGVQTLPAIATMFGPRIVPDIGALEALVADRIQDRRGLGFADVGSVLGHARARTYLREDLQRFATLNTALDRSRTTLAASAQQGTDLYNRWLSAVLALSAPNVGVHPTFMRTEAWQDFRLNSALVGYAQIRHNYVLMAGQGYDSYGCEIPDGYVEPAVEVYDALIGFARAAQSLSPAQGPFLRGVARVLETLRSIAMDERAGHPLTEAQKRWLGMVAEYIPRGGYGGDSGQPPKWTGWYFDLFPDREIGAEKAANFVADYFTLTTANQVMYLGAQTPRMGAFVVDTNGAPRMMVGPVARGYESSTEIGPRLNDESAESDGVTHSAPWRSSYMVETMVPQLETSMSTCNNGQHRMALRSTLTEGTAEVQLLDHHGDPLSQRSTARLGATPTFVSFESPRPNHAEFVHVRLISTQNARFDYTLQWIGEPLTRWGPVVEPTGQAGDL